MKRKWTAHQYCANGNNCCFCKVINEFVLVDKTYDVTDIERSFDTIQHILWPENLSFGRSIEQIFRALRCKVRPSGCVFPLRETDRLPAIPREVVFRFFAPVLHLRSSRNPSNQAVISLRMPTLDHIIARMSLNHRPLRRISKIGRLSAGHCSFMEVIPVHCAQPELCGFTFSAPLIHKDGWFTMFWS